MRASVLPPPPLPLLLPLSSSFVPARRIVRNSWASTWGEDGYIYLEMAKNTCGLANDVTIPEIKLDASVNTTKAALRRESMYRRATM